MPLHHHGGTPHTKRQQHTKNDADTAVFEESAGIEREIHTEPFNHGRWEQAGHTHTAGTNPAPTTGGTLTTPQGIAAALRGIAEPANPTPELMAAVDAAVQQSLANIDSLREQAAAHLDAGSPNLADIMGAVERAKASVQESGEAAKAALDNLWTDVADVLVAIDRAADAIGAV